MGEGYPKDSFFSKAFYPGGFALMGILAPVIKNYNSRQPLRSGIHRHVIFGLVGFAFGLYINDYFDRKWSERDAVIRHYIELHPEDFVEEKRKFKEIFAEWYPVR